MDYPHKQCAVCKKTIDDSSNYITIAYDTAFVYFHRFCYYNYRMKCSAK